VEVIVDTNVLMNAIFDQPNHECCWQVLRLLRRGEIIPVVSKGLLREYIYVPQKIVMEALADKSHKSEITKTEIQQMLQDLYDCATDTSNLMDNCRIIKAVSTQKISPDPDDDKIINLAIDANCTVIITHNISDFKCVEEKHIKTKSSKDIDVYTPEQFVDYFKLIQHYNKGKRAN
jgi:predicted nucleic acid-binding protein